MFLPNIFVTGRWKSWSGRSVMVIIWLWFPPAECGKSGLIEHWFRNESIVRLYYTFFVDIYAIASLRDFVFLLSKVILEGLKPRVKEPVLFLRAVGGMSWEICSWVPPVLYMESIALPVYTAFAIRNFEQGGKTIVPEVVELLYRQFEGITWYL
mgnify:FL=1